MATVKVKFKPSSIAGKKGTIFYQIIHERRVRQVFTSCHIYSEEWNEKTGNVVLSGDYARNRRLAGLREHIRQDAERLKRIIRRLEIGNGCYTADDVASEFEQYSDEYSLFNYMESLAGRLKSNGRVRTAESYRSALASFKAFRNDEDIMLDSLTSDIMEDYEAWLKNRKVVPNTISYYMRTLRAVYNRAVENGTIENTYPFRRVYTGIDKTVKRALPMNVLKKIKELDLTLFPTLDYARDMFMMSFYLRGMSFVDMAFLRKENLTNGLLSYRRRKTGQLLSIRWQREMQTIVDKYGKNDTPYLLPIIRRNDTNERYAYRNRQYAVNRALKEIAEKVGIKIPLTMYVARHSWASAARMKGVPISVISEGMGHDSESTTKIYLAQLDSDVVDDANALIIGSL